MNEIKIRDPKITSVDQDKRVGDTGKKSDAVDKIKYIFSKKK